MHGRTQAHGRDGTIGASFAAPKVSRIAAELQAMLPEESCLLHRALIVQSAQHAPRALSRLFPGAMFVKQPMTRGTPLAMFRARRGEMIGQVHADRESLAPVSRA